MHAPSLSLALALTLTLTLTVLVISPLPALYSLLCIGLRLRAVWHPNEVAHCTQALPGIMQ
ncbi:hypothetical protein BU24DRAFT_417310 [Aaosphaeria arxii CBS 175.79]|uniref:Uncharacterized protein n=1 Tax=Aaosphaeria arxii CBS 175.79 TaxID=1450172 RepID=A0A6A5Y7X0_9PLEO|nr:uncharacterized protein BU24DRAFT_417310 [Aaosphaeria arxii CBS 175.79]KAF2021672.1 hypothetical protein BU24DRAFT_417310 [Aaosphaeria arxii CBS 175.79]